MSAMRYLPLLFGAAYPRGLPLEFTARMSAFVIGLPPCAAVNLPTMAIRGVGTRTLISVAFDAGAALAAAPCTVASRIATNAAIATARLDRIPRRLIAGTSLVQV